MVKANADRCISCEKKEICLTTHMDDAVLQDAMNRYEEEENHRVMIAAAEVESDHYCQYTRVEEIMAFAEKIGAKKIGIATCVGLLRESRTLASILRAHGFEVFGVACKTGAQKKTSVGIPERCMLWLVCVLVTTVCFTNIQRR